MKIHVLALDGVFDTGLATVLDSFATANELAEMFGHRSTRFDVAIVGVRNDVRTSHGLSVPVVLADELPAPDWVIVPAPGYKMPATLQAALARPDVRDAANALRRWADNVSVIAAACIGAFVLAESS